MPRQAPPLYLHEEVMLLALRDEKGTVDIGSMYAYALGGALLAELLLAGRIEIEDDGRKKLVNVLDTTPLGEPILDECLQKLAAAKRRAKPETWVERFASLKNLHHRVAAGLCDRRILRQAQDKILLIFSRTIYPEINPQPERRLIERLRRAIFTDTPRVEPRTAILVSLANSADLLQIPFDRRELKRHKDRIEQLGNGQLMGHATRQAVDAAQTAILVACIVPVIVAST